MTELIRANYPSRCVVCDENIEIDDLIKFSEEEDRWVHEDCCEED